MPGTRYLIPLGAGTVAAAGAGNKAALLDRSKRAGLPVPAGFVLLAEGKGRLNQAPAFQRKIAVRAAFSAEDHPWESLAGFFLSILWVDPKNPEEFRGALGEVWQSAARRPGEFRRDILLHEMVDAHTSGVAFTERDFEDDLINWTRGTGERLLAGDVRGFTLELPKLRRGESSRLAPASPGFAPRVQGLLRDIRRVFGPYDWELEWADDGRTCWLLQVRPITHPLPRNESFTPVAAGERLLAPASRFLATLSAACAQPAYARFRDLDPALPNDRLLFEVFEGRALLNVSLLRDTARMWGLPEALVSRALALSFRRPAPANWRRMAAVWPALLRLGGAQLGARTRARRLVRRLQAGAEHRPASFRDAAEQVRWFHTRLAREWLAQSAVREAVRLLSEKLGPFAAPLRGIAGRLDQARALLRKGAEPVWDVIRRRVDALAEDAGLTDGCLWLLSEEEVLRLDEGWRPSRAFVAERQRETARQAQCALPELVRRFDNFEAFYPAGEAADGRPAQSI